MWVRGAAIRPVPPYARIAAGVLDRIERELSKDAEDALDAERPAKRPPPRVDLDASFERFEATQPALAERVAEVLGKPLDETALALGYFLSIAVWLAFERSFPGRLAAVDAENLRATSAAIALEEELRAGEARAAIEVEDVVAQEQPNVVAFVHAHLEAALEAAAATVGEDVDVDDVHTVYRTVLLEALALSYAVGPPEGTAVSGGNLPGGSEILA